MSSSNHKTMEKKLQTAFSPQSLEVINESHLHSGHHHDGGDKFDGSGETHFRIKIVSSDFTDLTKIQIHRAINQVLQDELNSGVHALAIEAKA